MVVFEVPLARETTTITQECSLIDSKTGKEFSWKDIFQIGNENEILEFIKEKEIIREQNVRTINSEDPKELFNALTEEEKNFLINIGCFSKITKQKVGVFFMKDDQFKLVYKKHCEGQHVTRVITSTTFSVLKEDNNNIPQFDHFTALVYRSLFNTKIVNELFFDKKNEPFPFEVPIPEEVTWSFFNRRTKYGIRNVNPITPTTNANGTLTFNYIDKPPQRKGYFFFDKIKKIMFKDITTTYKKNPELVRELNNSIRLINSAGKTVAWLIEIEHFYPKD